MKTKCNKLIALLLSLTMLMGVVMSIDVWAAGISQITLTCTGLDESQLPDSASTLFVDETGYQYDAVDYAEDHDGFKVSAVSKNSVTLVPNGSESISLPKNIFTFGIFNIENVNFEVSYNGKVQNPKATDYTSQDTDATYSQYELGMRGANGNIEITVKATTAPKTVTIPTSSSWTISNVKTNGSDATKNANGTYAVPAGQNLSFDCVSTRAGYGVEVRWGNEAHQPEGNTYTIDSVNEDTVVEIYSVPATYTVKLANEGNPPEGYTTDIRREGETVSYNNRFTFTVTPDPGHQAPKSVKYSMGKSVVGQVLQPSGNSYTIPSVTDNVTITIEPGDAITYQVIFHNTDGVTFNKEGSSPDLVDGEGVKTATVEYNSNYTFTISLEPQYNPASVTVLVNGAPLRLSSGKYTIQNITEDKNIVVSGLALNIYTVTPPTSKTGQYTIRSLGSASVQHGGSYQFEITVDPAYFQANSKPQVTLTQDGGSAEASVSEAVGYTYTVTISNITANITGIAISGLDTKNQLDLKDADASGDLNTDHATVEFDNAPEGKITYGESATFHVKTDPGYKVTSVTYTMGNSGRRTLTSESSSYIEGTGLEYQIPSVTDACSITVTTAAVIITVQYTDWQPNKTRNTVQHSYGEAGGMSLLAAAPNLNVNLETPTCTNYNFLGWYKDSGLTKEQLVSAENPVTYGHKDEVVNLYGKWEVDYDSLFNVTLSSATKSGTDGETILDLTVGWNPKDSAVALAESENIELVYAGILYSNKEFTFKSLEEVVKEMEEKVATTRPADHSGEPPKISTSLQDSAGTVYCYSYANPRMDENSPERNSTKTVRFRVKSARYAVGWIAIRKDNGETIYITFDNTSGSKQVYPK